MRRAFWMFPLLLISCSCQEAPAPQKADEAVAEADQAQRTASPATPATAPPTLSLLAAVSADAERPGAVVHAYIRDLLQRRQTEADAAWQFAPSGTRADDAALRGLQDVISLRINTGAPIARDQQQPSRLIEIPVQVRAVTDTATLRYTGWYRLVPDPQGSAWRIHSAQIQPVLD